MPLPALSTPRLDLRERTAADLDALVALAAEPEVMRFVGDGTVPDPAAHRAELVGRLRMDLGPGLGFWTLRRQETGAFLGWACLVPLPGWPEVELGYRLTRAAWGHGYATEAGRAVVAHAFDTIGLPEVVAVSDPANVRSHRVLARLGFQRAGTRACYGRDAVPFFRLAAGTRRPPA